MAWEKYQSAARDFDSVLEHAKAVSASLNGITPTEQYLSYAEQIFVKVLSHCIVLRRMSPDPMRHAPSELWDLASVSAIARCVIEAHDAFMYIASASVQTEEREFRLYLWELHDKSRRKKMLELIGSKDPRNSQMAVDVESLHQKVVNHQFFAQLSPGVRKKILDADPPPYHLSQKERCKAAGIDPDYYNAVTMQLSQYVHTLPYAVHQLFAFEAGTPDAIALMAMPLQYVLPYLANTTEQMRSLFPSKSPQPPSRVAQKMALWSNLAKQGLKGQAEPQLQSAK
jgi:hypothetical protein